MHTPLPRILAFLHSVCSN